ncbi:pentapeptide repeat-containing protein [Sphingomonas sp. CV7422]|uniref:pentapeptide repeat-containing protein n=1 Tax=Sphingomonas sp. CV7422 TaxID=3018036 RepID=UPI0022FE1BB7|nr:pentapeptide repeat-containing protein [Sphingomonas sp. CV7422]
MMTARTALTVSPAGGDDPIAVTPPAGIPAPDPVAVTVATGTTGIRRLAPLAAAVVLSQQGFRRGASGRLDLHGQDLRDVDLKTLDLRGADLSGVDLPGKDLSGLDLSGANLAGARLDGATLVGTNLHGVKATGASFTKAHFDLSDLSEADFTGARFADARFGGFVDDMAGDDGTTIGAGYVIRKSKFTNADFSRAVFEAGATIVGSTIDGATFDGARLGTVTFAQGSMRGASFERIAGILTTDHMDATNADFRHIDGATIRLRTSKVDGASFADSNVQLTATAIDLRHVDLSVAHKDLRNAAFTDCVMTGMDFSGFDFRGATFRSTGPVIASPYLSSTGRQSASIVSGVNFHNARFDGASFRDFDLRKAQLDAGALRGTTIGYGDDTPTFVSSDRYDIKTVFRDAWPRDSARRQHFG